MTFWQKVRKTPNNVAVFVIWLYRTLLSPSVGILRYLPFYPKNTCIFYPTCSEYSLVCYKKYSFWKATIKSLNRIRRCHPGNEPAVDQP